MKPLHSEGKEEMVRERAVYDDPTYTAFLRSCHRFGCEYFRARHHLAFCLVWHISIHHVDTASTHPSALYVFRTSAIALQ
jgi:hypothetical protein